MVFRRPDYKANSLHFMTLPIFPLDNLWNINFHKKIPYDMRTKRSMVWSAGQNEAAFVMVLITKKSNRKEKCHECRNQRTGSSRDLRDRAYLQEI